MLSARTAVVRVPTAASVRAAAPRTEFVHLIYNMSIEKSELIPTSFNGNEICSQSIAVYIGVGSMSVI